MTNKTKLDIFNSLSRTDWEEIYSIVDESVQDKLPPDGHGITEDDAIAITDADWIIIYGSVEDKRDALKCGLYGRDRVAREWREHLESLLGILSPVADEYIGHYNG